MQTVEMKILLSAANGSSIDDLTRKLSGLKDTAAQSSSAMDRLSQVMKSLGLNSSSATTGVTQFLPALSSVGVVAAGVGAALLVAGKATYDFVEGQAKLAKETTILADRLGVTVGQAEKLKFMAERTGSSLEGFGTGSVRLAAALGDAHGEGKKASEALRLLGINTSEASGKQKEIGSLLLETSKRLSQVDNEAKRTLLSTRIFGEDGAKSLKALLKGYEEADAAARKLGVGTQEEATKKLLEADNAVKELEKSIGMLKTTIAAGLSPLIIPIIADVTAMINGQAGQGQIGGRTGELMRIASADPYKLFAQDGRSALDRLSPSAKGLLDPVIPDEKAAKERERLAKKAEEERKKAAARLEQKNTSFDQILDSLDQKALDPFARLLFETGDRLQELVKKYGGLTGADRESFFSFDELGQATVMDTRGSGQAGAAGDAFRRALARLNESRKMEFESAPNSTQNTLSYQLSNFLPQSRTTSTSLQNLRGQLGDATEDFRARVAFQERMIELLSGPGGEVEAAKKIRDLRIETAQNQQEANQASLDYQIRIASLAKQQKDDFRAGLGSTFDALVSGKSGIKGYLSGIGLNTGKTIFQNVGSLAYDAAKDSFRLPGQTNSDGKLNLFGKALQGTPLGVDPLKFSTDKNTEATNLLTDEMRRTRKALAGESGLDLNMPLPGIVGGTLGSLISDGNGITGKGGILNKVSPRASSALTSFGSGAASVLSAGLFAGLRSGDYSVTLPDGSATTASALGLTSGSARLGNTVASAGALATAGFGVYSGIKQGGARGVLTASASAAGAASTLLMMLAPASGPAAPILAAAALGLSLAPLLLGDPKKQRDSAIGREVDSRRFSDFSGTSYSTDVFGRSFDYSSRGDLRPIIVTVNAMDASGFVDRRDDIAEAVRMAMSESHPIVKEIQSVIVPAQ